MLTSSSEGCDRDGLFAAILFTAAAMIEYETAAMRIGKYEVEKVESDGDQEFRDLAIVRLRCAWHARARLTNLESSAKVVTVVVFGFNKGCSGVECYYHRMSP